MPDASGVPPPPGSPARQRLARTSERVGGRMSSAARPRNASKRDAVAAHVALGEQQFDRALGLTEPMQRSGTGGIDDEDRRRPRVAPIALHPEILGAHFDAGRLRGMTCQLPRRAGADARVATGPPPAASR